MSLKTLFGRILDCLFFGDRMREGSVYMTSFASSFFHKLVCHNTNRDWHYAVVPTVKNAVYFVLYL